MQYIPRNSIDVKQRGQLLEVLNNRHDFFQYDKSQFGGIYVIFNKENGKVYVGQTRRSIDEYLYKERLTALRRGNMHNKHLQTDWNSFGEEAFEIFSVEYIDPKIENYEETLNNLEAFYINLFDAYGFGGYNLLSTYDKGITFEDIFRGLEFKKEDNVYNKKSVAKYNLPKIPKVYILNPAYTFKNKKIHQTTITNQLNKYVNSDKRFNTFEELVVDYIQYSMKFQNWSQEEIHELHFAFAQKLKAMGVEVIDEI